MSERVAGPREGLTWIHPCRHIFVVNLVLRPCPKEVGDLGLLLLCQQILLDADEVDALDDVVDILIIS